MRKNGFYSLSILHITAKYYITAVYLLHCQVNYFCKYLLQCLLKNSENIECTVIHLQTSFSIRIKNIFYYQKLNFSNHIFDTF